MQQYNLIIKKHNIIRQNKGNQSFKVVSDLSQGVSIIYKNGNIAIIRLLFNINAYAQLKCKLQLEFVKQGQLSISLLGFSLVCVFTDNNNFLLLISIFIQFSSK